MRLDADEQAARELAPVAPIEAADVVAYLQNLELLWAEAPRSRRALAEALFERIDVLGLRRIDVTPTAGAIGMGLAEAFRSGTHVYGRGERI